MSTEENKTVMRRFLKECVGEGNFEVYTTSFAPHLEMHLKGMQTHDHSHQSFSDLIKDFHQAISGRDVNVDDLIGEGDHVATRWSIGGTHDSHWREHAPTDEAAQFEGVFFARFDQGKVVELWDYFEGPAFDYSPK